MKQNWSRRELEAFGEALGNSVTQRKLGGGYICGGGGKGGGGGSPPPPAQQTVTQTSIPEYAAPYVQTMLGKSEALTDINQNPYQAYGGQRIAPFNTTQQQAFNNITSQQTAGQLGTGTAMAGVSGLGSIGTANQLGQVGQQYANQATSPDATRAYMSPYMQNVVDVQKNEAFRDAQMRNIGANLGSARQGTYGGARQLLGEQERNRNLQQGLANIQATGTQNAFQDAQRSQQFGANLGLQGLQGQLAGYGQANQAAGTLGQLGVAQFGQEQAINQGIQNVGNIQQAQAQQGLDLGYQDFLKQRNYPYQQLAFMSDMTRGIPLSQSAQQIYTAPPSQISQLGGLGMSALGIYGMSGGFRGAKEGGLMAAKAYKEGGLAYSTGGDIKMMSTDQLEALLEKPGLTPLEVGMIEEQLILRRRMAMNPQTDEIMAPALRSGIASIGTGEMVPENMAGGGIVAFAGKDDSLVKDGVDNIKDASNKSFRDRLEAELFESLQRQKTIDPFKESRAQEAEIREEMRENKRIAPYRALAMTGLGTMAGTSQHPLSNLGLGGIEGVKSYAQSMREQDDARKLLLLQGGDREKSSFGREAQRQNVLAQTIGGIDSKAAALEAAKFNRSRLDQDRKRDDINAAQRTFDLAVKNEKNILFQQDKFKYNMDSNDSGLESAATANVLKRMSPALKGLLFPDGVPTFAAPPPAPAETKKPDFIDKVKNLFTSDNLPKPTTKAEYDNLKSGSTYMHPDGNIKTKP